MSYSVIQPPFTLDFSRMPKNELRDYFQWFLAVLPQRIGTLTESVKESPGFETWLADRTPASLCPLGDWFANQVETRQRTRQEIDSLAAVSAYPVDTSPGELTNRPFSIAMDTGMYLSQVLLRNHPSLRWEHPLRSKNFVDYGQPVLVRFEWGPLNPVRVMVTLAYAFADKSKTGRELKELYDVWSAKVQK